MFMDMILGHNVQAMQYQSKRMVIFPENLFLKLKPDIATLLHCTGRTPSRIRLVDSWFNSDGIATGNSKADWP
jgi:hypothetical protein